MNSKPVSFENPFTNRLIAFLVFLSAFAAYIISGAPSLSFWDSGEYITCSSILGVPHPPGNPFYIMLGKFVTTIFGFINHARVVSALSGFLSALGVMFTYLFTVKLVSMFEKDKFVIYIAGILAAFYTAFSYTYWMNSVEAEVYAGLAFIINIIIWLTLVWAEKSEDFSHQNILLLIIYIFFLGFGIHQTSLQIVPAVLFVILFPMLKENFRKSNFWVKVVVYTLGMLIIYFVGTNIGKSIRVPDFGKFIFGIASLGILIYHLRDKFSMKAWVIGGFIILAGLSTHIFLLVRSEFRPFINEGNPHNLALFTDYILRRQYGVTSFLVRRASFYYQFTHHFLRYFSWQFFNATTISEWIHTPIYIVQTIANLIVTGLGFGGAYYQWKKNKTSFMYFFAFFFMTSFAMIFVINLSDAEVRDRDYFFSQAYNLWTFWMAVGSIGVYSYFKKSFRKLSGLILLILFILPTINLFSQFHEHDRSHELLSLDYGLNILNSLEKNAIVFTNGDNDTFPLWYEQAVKDPNCKEFVYPETNVQPTQKTKDAIKKEMDFKSTELHGIRKDVSVANLSLLNTPWYIRQLRDREGILFNVPDKQIDKLMPVKLPQDTNLTFYNPAHTDSLTILLKKDKPLWIKDLATIQIIRDNFGKRPIYFAVTCSEVDVYRRNFKNEGMVDRLVGNKDIGKLNLKRLENNLNNVYEYRGVFGDKLYKDDNMKRLVSNYGAAYLRISQYYSDNNNPEKAFEYYEKGVKFFLNNETLSRYLPLGLDLVLSQNDDKKVLDYINKNIAKYPGDSDMIFKFGYLLSSHDKYKEKAFKLLNMAAVLQPSNTTYQYYIFNIASQTKEYEKGIDILQYMEEKTQSSQIKKFIDELRAKIK